MTAIPSETLIDVLYRLSLTKFLISGLVFCISLKSMNVSDGCLSQD